MIRKHTAWHILVFIGLALFLGACSGAVAAELPEELPDSVEVEIEDGRQELEFTGTLDDQAGDEWTVSGVTFAVTPETEIHSEIGIGDSVKVHAFLDADGNLTARELELAEGEDRPDDVEEEDEGEFEFTGTVESIGPEAWTIGGRTVAVTPATEIEPGLAVGDLVKVHAFMSEGGALTAREIDPAELDDDLDEEDDDGEVEFVGVIESVSGSSLVVDGITIQIADSTEIEADLIVGNTVKVEAFADSGGTLIAEEIESVDEDDQDESEFDDEDERDEDEDEDDHEDDHDDDHDDDEDHDDDDDEDEHEDD